MKKYRKKPVIIEAVKLTKKNILEVYSEIYGKPKLDSEMAREKWWDFEDIVELSGINVPTKEGDLRLTIGNYLVKGYSEKLGYHYWPVDADYFEQYYEIV